MTRETNGSSTFVVKNLDVSSQLWRNILRVGTSSMSAPGLAIFAGSPAKRAGWRKGWRSARLRWSHGRQHFRVEYTSLDRIAEASVDAITCHHVLEHLAHPREFLETIRRKLVPGGLVVIHVPHPQPLTFWLRDRLTRDLCPDRDTPCCLYGSIHISGFTRGSLRNAVERVGCLPESVGAA